jgi:pyridoxal phosphate enzyme (YggS family)
MDHELTSSERQELQERYERIRSRIERACDHAGRSSDDVVLVAVSKTFPLARIKALSDFGHRDFGENKVQEMREKIDQLPGRKGGGDLVWHAIGHLQRNKARIAVPRADVFHALDSVRLAEELELRCGMAEETMDCLVQVNVSGEESKFGLDPTQLASFLENVAPLERLRITGLMTLAAPAPDPEMIRPQFKLLRQLRDKLQPKYPALTRLSMGMSGDFEVAIQEGATHVRIGSAIFGSRTYP